MACATTGAPSPSTGPGAGTAFPGVRLLYDARLETPEGRHPGFRLAAALAPPARLRIEALGPAGGVRLILATDGSRAVAIAIPDRRFEATPATPAALERWTGLALGPAGLVALLRGGAPCAGEAGGDCPGLRFRPAAAGCGGDLVEAAGGRVRAVIACERAGEDDWPRRIRVEFPLTGRTLELRRSGEPAPADLPAALFDPAVPAGFAPGPLSGDPAAGPLLDGAAEAGR